MSTTFPLASALLLLAACSCPREVVDYSTPDATLQTWQAQFCHDDPAGEYACFAADFKREIVGFETYHAAREKLLADQPFVAWLLKRADLPDYVAERSEDPAAGTARLVLAVDEQRLQIAFVREVWSLVDLIDGAHLATRLDVPLADLVIRRPPQQWISLGRGPLTEGQVLDLRRITFEPRWKIRWIDGLLPTEGITP